MTALPETKSVDLSLENGWLTVWFNQPERRNPLTDDVVDDLEIILASVRDDRSVRGVTFRGRGGFFCAGVIPMRVSEKANLASFIPTLTSQQQARPRPPAMAAPSIMATVT